MLHAVHVEPDGEVPCFTEQAPLVLAVEHHAVLPLDAVAEHAEPVPPQAEQNELESVPPCAIEHRPALLPFALHQPLASSVEQMSPLDCSWLMLQFPLAVSPLFAVHTEEPPIVEQSPGFALPVMEQSVVVGVPQFPVEHMLDSALHATGPPESTEQNDPESPETDSGERYPRRLRRRHSSFDII